MLLRMPQRRLSLASLTRASSVQARFISSSHTTINLNDLYCGYCFEAKTIDRMRGRSVLLATTKQLASALAAIDLDGVARRIYLCTPDLVIHLPAIVAQTEVDFAVSEESDAKLTSLGVPFIQSQNAPVSHDDQEIARDIETEWVLFTSGTTGRPKMVVHTLSSLSGPLDDGVAVDSDGVWSTFYDIRRYGGLQILLRALIGGGSMILSDAEEPFANFMTRLAARGVTHISGTPSHWRRALMSPQAGLISPAYVRLSGEVADQAILDRLKSRYPNASIAHAFASTEAGVGFDVRDGLAGFPASFLPHPNGQPTIEMKVENDTLRIRSSRTASRYLGQDLPQSDGFIDTADMVERRGDRFYFIGRKEGVINVGGQKVYPEEVENVITQHPDVLVARVSPRKSPVIGSIVAADIVLRAPLNDGQFASIVESLRAGCRQALAPHKVPVTWKRVAQIDMTISGKVKRV
jgi:acyl-coenzyme A synthetase/AMP-(fatty) acid ligase